jgi:hypothetical protein
MKPRAWASETVLTVPSSIFSQIFICPTSRSRSKLIYASPSFAFSDTDVNTKDKKSSDTTRKKQSDVLEATYHLRAAAALHTAHTGASLARSVRL